MLPIGFYDFADRQLVSDIEQLTVDKTYDLNNPGRFIDGKEAVRQAVYKLLRTQRLRSPVYSADYGLESDDLSGKDCDYVCIELERRIAEALLVDKRIVGVSGFDFVVKKGVIYVSFIVSSVFGEFNEGREFRYV